MSAAKLAICLLAATAVDAAYLRKGGKSEQSRPDSRRLDEDCADDSEWYHKNRGPDYDCAYLDPEDYGEPEVTEICIGTSWTYLGGLFRKSKVDEDAPPCVEINQ